MKSSFTKFRVFLLLLMLAIGVIAVWFWRSLSHLPKEIRHIVLVSIDTCRADYLSCYGYRRQTTPNIDKFAEESILFTNVISPVPLTLPAHSSMLTGSIPPYHGIHDNFDYRLDESNVTLAEILKEAGFTTGAIISAFVLDSLFGLDQGFDTYNDEFEEEHMALNISERKGDEASRFALQWLDQHKDEKFFLFLHYYDPHSGYEPPEPFASQFSDSPYAGEIAYTDDCIGVVIKKLKELGLYDSSLIIITGDHGEMLGEHGESTHMYFIYQSAIKVPLIFKLPGRGKGERIDEPVGIIDIVPTICSALGIAIPSGVQGKALFGQSRAGKDRYIYCESLYATKYGGNSLLGVVTDEFKYIQTTRPELYDLVKDPREMNNLVKKQPQRARILQDRLKQILEQSVRKDDSESKLELDEQARKRLESLGYVGGGVTEDFDFDQSKDDPKDLIGFHAQGGKAHTLIRQKKYEEAETICEKMVEERPQYVDGYILLARIATEQGDFEGSVPHLYRALELEPERFETHNGLGTALSRLGKHEEALKHFEESVRMRPGKPEVLVNLGWCLYEQGKYGESVAQYIKALEIEPDQAKTHFHLGKALARQGKLDEALARWNEALRLTADKDDIQKGLRNDIAERLAAHGRLEQAVALWNEIIDVEPNNTAAHKNLGAAFLQQAQLDQAIFHLAEALQAAPDNYEIRYNIALAFSRTGNYEKAITHWRKAVELKGDRLGALNDLAWVLGTHTDESLRNPTEAVELSERACELTGYKDPLILDTLSAAYASAGRFSEAVQTAEKAMGLLISSGQEEVASQVAKHLELFKAGEPYLELPQSQDTADK